MEKTLKILLVCLVFISFAKPVHADNETKQLLSGIAAGLVGMAINGMNHSNETPPAEDIQWNEQKPEPQTVLQYQDDVAEAQIKLKKLGYYNGKIDGLQGRQTTEAIESWEHHNSNASNGKISAEEMLILTEQTSYQNTAKPENISQQVQGSKEKQVSSFIAIMEQNKDFHAVCTDFINSGTTGANQIDPSFEENFEKITKLYEEHLDNIVKCHDLTEDELEQIHAAAQKAYNQTDNAKMYQMALAMGSQSLTEEQANRRIKACNIFSQANLTNYNISKNEKFDHKTCQRGQ